MAKHKETKWKQQSIASEKYGAILTEHFSSRSFPDHIAIDGMCPICFGTISTKSPKQFQAPNASEDVVGQGSSGPVHWTVVVECNCGQSHPGDTKESEGCGMALRILVADD